jgi:Autotransporter beta-domain/Autochaperone Domain Type 1
MGNQRKLGVLTRVTAKRRKSWLLAASALASSSLGISGPALAANECGALDATGSVICTSAGNNYVTGITYGQPLPLPLNVTLNSDVNVNLSGPGIGVALNNFGGGGPVLLSANGATINVTQVPSSSGGNRGLYVETQVNDATITASGQIAVAGEGGGNHAIKAFVNGVGPGNASVTYGVPGPGGQLLPGAGLSSSGTNSTVIQAQSLNGNATINASGNMTGHVTSTQSSENTFVGLFANAGGDGNASVTYHSGTINVQGRASNGIFAGADGNGTAEITTLLGTTIIVSGTNPGEIIPTKSVTAGMSAELAGAAALGSAITVNAASTINMFGVVTPNASIFGNPVGIRALSKAVTDSAPIVVNYTGPGITTEGGGGIGILALANGGGGSGINSGGVAVASSGPITTNGAEALGIVADSGTIYNATHSRPELGPGGNVTVTASGAISTQGAEAHGIWAASTTGTVLVNAFNNVSTTGQFSTGINAISTGVPATGAAGSNVMVNVAQGVSVAGGWQDTGVGSSTLFALPAAGVILSSTGGTATLNNFGSIGALSDRAVAGDPVVINNGGTITGFVQFTGGGNSITNNGLFDLRHFADTDGNGVRDTVRVAIADLGEGLNNSFANNGTLRLAGVTGAATVDSTGQYLPLGNPNNAMALGALQGHLIGVATFTNSGVIDLQSNPVAGDVLAITGARQVGPAPTFPIAGVPGPGTFISNGGALRLDTVLNEGGAATRSDTLVVDGTSVGAGGPTNMAIRNAGGTGALTVGDGILVVQVLNPSLSASGAFSLSGGSITAGAFDYFLFKNGVTQGSQGNWYLRSTIVAPPITPPGEPPITPPEAAPGTPPLPTPVPGAPPIPLFQPGVAVMSVVPSVARTLGLLTLGTFNERQGDQLLVRGGCSRETQNRSWAGKSITGDENCITKVGAWGRVFGQHRSEHFAQGARPDFDGTFAGFQVGADLLRLESINGHSDHVGFYVAQARASGSVHGSVDGFEGALAGHVDLDASSFGGYWTHLGPSNWYIDTVVQGTHFDGTPNSIRGVSTAAKGDAFAGSIEAGYPIALAPWLTFEPQVQGIWQRVWLNDALVPVATISFDRADVFTGRAGALLRGSFGSTGALWQPYLKGNVWWGTNGFDTVAFNSFGIPTGRNGGTMLEGGGGVTGKLTRYVSVYGDASYLSSVSGESLIALKGNVGLRVTW